MATMPIVNNTNKKGISIPNRIDFLPIVGDFIRGEMRSLLLEEALIFDVQIAVDEAITNIIQYAFPDGSESEIDISCYYQGEKFIVQIRDTGKPFDPTQMEEPKLSDQLEERTEGGLGVMFMKQLMDELRYVYREPEGYEELTLVKNVG